LATVFQRILSVIELTAVTEDIVDCELRNALAALNLSMRRITSPPGKPNGPVAVPKVASIVAPLTVPVISPVNGPALVAK